MASSTAVSVRLRASSRSSASISKAEAIEGVEFIDVGCGDGGSTTAVRKRLRVTGKSLGIDRSGKRLPKSDTRSAMYVETDLLDLPNRKQCQFTTLINVLPSALGYAPALELLRKACMISRDFVYVSQVNFDCSPYLLRLGLKTYYSDVTANRFQGTTSDYYRMARTLMEQELIQDFSIIESGRILDSSDDVIHPLQTPPDSGFYDPVIHRYKPNDIVFRDPIYRRLQIILTRKPAQLVPISRRLRDLEEQENVVVSSS